jgi:hypothetical protein
MWENVQLQNHKIQKLDLYLTSAYKKKIYIFYSLL